MRFSSLIPLDSGGFSFEAGEIVLERAAVEIEGKPFYVSTARHGAGAPYTWGTLLPGAAPPPVAAVEIPSNPEPAADASPAADADAPAGAAEDAASAEPDPPPRKRRAKPPIEDPSDADE